MGVGTTPSPRPSPRARCIGRDLPCREFNMAQRLGGNQATTMLSDYCCRDISDSGYLDQYEDTCIGLHCQLAVAELDITPRRTTCGSWISRCEGAQSLIPVQYEICRLCIVHVVPRRGLVLRRALAPGKHGNRQSVSSSGSRSYQKWRRVWPIRVVVFSLVGLGSIKISADHRSAAKNDVGGQESVDQDPTGQDDSRVTRLLAKDRGRFSAYGWVQTHAGCAQQGSE